MCSSGPVKNLLNRDINIFFSQWAEKLTGCLFFLQDLNLGECPGFNDSWMDVVSSQGSSLLSIDLSGSDVNDTGLIHIKDCKNLEALNFNYCDQISDRGLEEISGDFITFFKTSTLSLNVNASKFNTCKYLVKTMFCQFHVMFVCQNHSPFKR